MKLVIVEDSETARTMLVSLLDGQDGYRVAAAVERVEEAVDYLADNDADLVVLDLCLPGLSYDLAVRAVKTAGPDLEILVFTVSEDDETVFSALKAGATGYLLKSAEPLQIIAALDEIVAGGSPMSPSIARKVLREFQKPRLDDDVQGKLSPLSKRETELLDFLYRGCNVAQISAMLYISPHTVHAHIKKIYAKLQVNSRSQAIYEAVQHNLIRH